MDSKHLTIDNGQLTFRKEDLLERVLNFGVRIIKLVNRLPQTPAGFKVGSQLVGSATSIGANTHEAQDASSKADFISKMSIALREAKESKFWLKLTKRAELLKNEDVFNELKEADEICAIYSTIVKRAKANLSNLKSQMSNETGQSLIEVIVVCVVGILVVTALTFTTLFSLRNANFAKTSAQATKLAQEGVERVRTGRDRIGTISNNFQLSGQLVTSWDDPDLWFYPINTNCIPNCYFNVNTSGLLQYLTAAASIPTAAEPVGQFKRVVILSDDTNYASQKIVTVIVTWTDTTGPHESRLTTILRKL